MQKTTQEHSSNLLKINKILQYTNWDIDRWESDMRHWPENITGKGETLSDSGYTSAEWEFWWEA